MTAVSFTVETDRDDLARNDLPMPEDWTLEDLVRADALGLLYAFELGGAAPDVGEEYRVRWQRAGRERHKGSILQTRRGAREKFKRLLEFEEVKCTDDFWSRYADMPDIVDATIEVRDVGPWRLVEHEERPVVHECATCGFGASSAMWVEGDGCPRCMREAERGRRVTSVSVPDDDIPF